MVRFGLRKFPLELPATQTAEQVNQVFLQFEIPADYDVTEKFLDESFKGVKLRLKQVQGKEKDSIQMS